MDPVACANRWHQWSVKGPKEVLAQVLERLDTALPPGWRRLSHEELQPHHKPVRPGSAWYALTRTEDHAGVTLSLERWGESELRGGWVWFAEPGERADQSVGIPGAWDEIMRLLDEGIVPAARSVGAQVRAPTTVDLFVEDLPADTAERLRVFSQSARKYLPLDRRETDLWRSFVVEAFRARAVVDGQPFTEWLVHDGWGPEAAKELSRRFLDECELLTRYADEASVA